MLLNMLLCDSGGALRMWSMCFSFCLSAVYVFCLMKMLISFYMKIVKFDSNDREVKPEKLGVRSS